MCPVLRHIKQHYGKLKCLSTEIQLWHYTLIKLESTPQKRDEQYAIIRNNEKGVYMKIVIVNI